MATPLDVPIAIVDKRRPKANVSEVMNIIGDIKGKNCILVDDMIDTAGTITNAANALVEMGANDVYACCTHGVLSGPAIERIQDSVINEMILLDTVPLPQEKKIEKISTLSVAELFAEAMHNIHTNSSVSKLFNPPH
jgi:ribose-phosphate pyrophosphokinase